MKGSTALLCTQLSHELLFLPRPFYSVLGFPYPMLCSSGYVFITNIPAGATDILIIERRKTENILGKQRNQMDMEVPVQLPVKWEEGFVHSYLCCERAICEHFLHALGTLINGHLSLHKPRLPHFQQQGGTFGNQAHCGPFLL